MEFKWTGSLKYSGRFIYNREQSINEAPNSWQRFVIVSVIYTLVSMVYFGELTNTILTPLVFAFSNVSLKRYNLLLSIVDIELYFSSTRLNGSLRFLGQMVHIRCIHLEYHYFVNI